jgi:hypothetical protein
MGAVAIVRCRIVIVLSVVLLASISVGLSSSTDESETKPKLTLYGYLKVDAAYDDSRVNPGNFARWVESESILPDDSQFSMTANQTRIGLKFDAPETNGVSTTGKLEIDFYGGGASENKSNPMLRKAYVAFAWPERNLEVLAGQASDIISPLTAPTVNYSAGWWQGNIGYRRAQIRVTKRIELSSKTKIALAIGPTRTISDSTFVTGPIDSGADAAVPTIQGRAGMSIAKPGGKTISVGLSGHWGKEDQHMTDALGTIIGHQEVDSWSANLDLSIPLSNSVLLQGEWFDGENLYAYLGAIGHNGEVGATGGWVALTVAPDSRWRFHVGGGLDDPDDDNLTAADARTRNAAFFANTSHTLTPNLSLALELMFLQTRYLAQADGDAMRAQFAVLYKF